MNQIDEKYWNLITKSLSKNLTDDEEEDLNIWLASDPSHLQLLQELKTSWTEAGQYDSIFTPNKQLAWSKISAELSLEENRSAPIRSLFNWTRVAAALIVIIGGWFIYQTFNQGNWIHIATENDVKEVLLPDSSKVWLSKNSSIRYNKGMNEKTEREIILEGEAFFEVKRNPAKPFLVQALGTETKVLGTSFNVLARKQTAEISVSVITGKVQFGNNNSKSKKLVLEPGTQGIYTKSTASLHKTQTSNNNFLFWKNNRLDFNAQALATVLKEVGDNYNVRFTINNANLNSERITTSFEKESLEEIINELEVLLDVRIIKSDTTYLIQTIK
jgi:transmembrane sensor